MSAFNRCDGCEHWGLLFHATPHARGLCFRCSSEAKEDTRKAGHAEAPSVSHQDPVGEGGDQAGGLDV